MHKFIMLENHPNDSRVKIDASGKTQSLTGRMGTGGGNVPLVLEIMTEDEDEAQMLCDRFPELSQSGIYETDVARTLDTARGEIHPAIYSETVGTLCACDYKGVGSQYVYEDKLVVEIWE